MHALLLVLSCLALIGHGRRTQTAAMQGISKTSSASTRDAAHEQVRYRSAAHVRVGETLGHADGPRLEHPKPDDAGSPWKSLALFLVQLLAFRPAGAWCDVPLRGHAARARRLKLSDAALAQSKARRSCSDRIGDVEMVERFKKFKRLIRRLRRPGRKANSSGTDVSDADYRPTLCLVNSKSGGRLGAKVKRRLGEYLHPAQIVDLGEAEPEVSLMDWKNETGYCVLACGGDGTVSWAIDEVANVHSVLGNASHIPGVGILPLGTGNDLARVLGWNKAYKKGGVLSVLDKLEKAKLIPIDRWMLTKDGASMSCALGDIGPKCDVFQNYFGIGLDASITKHYSDTRDWAPFLFFSPFLNKFWYGWGGVIDFIRGTCNDFSKKVRVEVDGKELVLPPKTRGLVLLNINSYASGQKLWHEGDSDQFGSNSMSDGVFELVAIRSAFQLGMVIAGVAKVQKVAQGSRISFEMSTDVPVQADGEPWIESPGTLGIESAPPAYMMRVVDEPKTRRRGFFRWFRRFR